MAAFNKLNYFLLYFILIQLLGAASRGRSCADDIQMHNITLNRVINRMNWLIEFLRKAECTKGFIKGKFNKTFRINSFGFWCCWLCVFRCHNFIVLRQNRYGIE